MPNRKLISIEDAARFAMAPTDDIMARSEDFQPEKALRNGHQSAARITVAPRKEPSQFVLKIEAWAVWLRDLFGPWWGGRAAA